jgi:DNA adenine methylase
MDRISPFLRWAGGKQWLSKQLAPLLKNRLLGKVCYFEPFLGSGAMFFASGPECSFLSDLNRDLILSFIEVRDNCENIIAGLKKIPLGEEKYYQMRSKKPKTNLQRAIRFIYLNRNCFGGLYRENKQGVFNVPYGGPTHNHRSEAIVSSIRAASSALQKSDASIEVSDFEPIINKSGAGDVVFCDPTYREVTRKQFDRYGKTIFDWSDQERLARSAHNAYNRGALVIICNANCDAIRSLYPQATFIHATRRKGIGANTISPSQLSENLIILDPKGDTQVWAKLEHVLNGT